MRKNFLLLLFLVITYIVSAAPFKFLPYSAEQPDGTIIECFVSGDEYFNWVHDADGYSIKKGSDGFYYYAVKKDNKILPSEFRVNTVNPENVGISKWTVISKEDYLAKRNKYDNTLAKSGISKAPHTGTFNNVVIYIKFSGESEITTTRQTYDDKLNPETGETLKAYFKEVSYNQLTINSTHYPTVANPATSNLSYEDSHTRDYFQPYDESLNTNGYQDEDEARQREHQLLVDAVTWINTNHPVPSELDIDADADGYVDNVCFMIQGGHDEWSDLLWAHRWSLWTYTVSINGKQVGDYTFQPEDQVSVRTLCHEMFHALGAPDLYHYYAGEDLAPVSSWDLMEQGSGYGRLYEVQICRRKLDFYYSRNYY
jgi:M6 family metalloprotease-like protein